MNIGRQYALAALVVIASAAPAAAQTYVSGGVGAAITRSYSSSSESFTFDANNAEVLSWMLRAGTSINSVLGVELEFVRDARIDIEMNPMILASATATGLSTVSASAVNPVRTAAGSQVAIFPTPQIDTRQRTTVWNATAFVRKSIAARSDLVFLGGIGISRVVQHSRVSYDPRLLPIRIDAESETTAYGIGPVVGAEARIGMTEHLRLTPGFRVQSLGNDLADGIDLRPSVTLGWSF